MTNRMTNTESVLLQDLRHGQCSSSLCKLLRDTAADEVERLGAHAKQLSAEHHEALDEVDRLRKQVAALTEDNRIGCHAILEVARLRTALGRIVGRTEGCTIQRAAQDACVMARDALAGGADEPSANRFDPASIPDCPRCGAAHWPQCPKKSSDG